MATGKGIDAERTERCAGPVAIWRSSVTGDQVLRDLLDTAERTVTELRQIATGPAHRSVRSASIPFPVATALSR